MDKYKDSIESNIYQLHVLDIVASFANIPSILYFQGPAFSDIVRESFYKVVCCEFPILLGHMDKDTNGSIRIVVNKDSLNLPDYQESANSMHFDELRIAKFDWKALPQNLDTVHYTPTAGNNGHVKLVNVHVVQFRDSSGMALFFSIPHFVVDGYGYANFLLRWSQVFQQMVNGVSSIKSDKRASFSHNRSLLEKTLEAIDSCKRSIDLETRTPFDHHTLLGKWLAWVSPNTRNLAIATVDRFSDIESHVFAIPTHKIRGHGLSLSDNDMLSALVSLVLSQSFDNPRKECLVTIPVDVRRRLDDTTLLDKKYCGNCVVHRSLQFLPPSDQADINSVTRLAEKIRATTSATDQSYIVGYVDMLQNNPTCFANRLVYGHSNQNRVSISNLSSFPFFSCNFGSTPVWVSHPPRTYKTYVSIHPKLTKDVYHIYICTGKATMSRLLLHRLWQDCAKLLY